MQRFSIEPRTRKHVKGYGFLSFASEYKKKLLNTVLDSLKTVSRKVFHKTGKFLGKSNQD